MRDACGMEARHVGGMRCGFVDLMTFLFVHLVLLEPGWGSTRAGSLGIHIHPNTPSRCHAVISLFTSPPRARGVVDGCFSVRFPFSLGVSTTPRAGRVGGSAAASRAKLPQQMLCRRVECAVVAHQRHAHIGKAENLQHGIMDTMGALKRNEQ